MSDDDLEMLMRRYEVVGPDPSLRGRVLAQRRPSGFYWEALAASVLVALCLMQVSASAGAVQPTLRLETTQIPADLLEGFTEEEIGAARFALAGSATLRVGLPRPGGMVTGDELWQTH